MNPADMKERNITPVSLIDITSHWQEEQRTLQSFYAIPYDIPRGSAAAYFPEANPLVPIDSTARESNTPTSKAVEISVQASSR
jgi:anaerobic selenocysteine-containing dehydrogenase